jgi:hypothetical protein
LELLGSGAMGYATRSRAGVSGSPEFAFLSRSLGIADERNQNAPAVPELRRF